MKPRILIKLGGSLLNWDSLQNRVKECLSTISQEKRPILVIGGGPAADAVRQWDQIHGLGDKTAHDIALHSLTLTETLVESLIPECERVFDTESLEEVESNGGWPILMSRYWLETCRNESTIELPENWTVTSDSIAAWLSAFMDIDELLLLKSTEYFSGTTLEKAAESGWVDSYFPTLIREIQEQQNFSVAWSNLRSEFVGDSKNKMTMQIIS